jgi:hypothetical protein
MSDRLALANAIEDAGIERGKAERVASVIFDAIPRQRRHQGRRGGCRQRAENGDHDQRGRDPG